MMDSLSRPQSVAVFGATSEIAGALIKRLSGPQLTRLVIAARPSAARDALVSSFATSSTTISALDFDAADHATHRSVVDAAFADGDLDLVVLAFGVLGSQEQFDADTDAAVEAAQVNYVGGVSIGMAMALLSCSRASLANAHAPRTMCTALPRLVSTHSRPDSATRFTAPAST